ncbi:hypothetical protein GCM10010423_76430 [Streptomyces levis]|uniref:Uncharacterized protein n=1 Tax=Streptomyces levis TaxID=285566 RepID=A0ABN3P8W1_9ACTN
MSRSVSGLMGGLLAVVPNLGVLGFRDRLGVTGGGEPLDFRERGSVSPDGAVA